jgi:HK97 family phage prohead protease
MERKSFTVADFKADAKRAGRFKALVAVFGNVDRGGDRIVKGAFTRSLEERGLPPIYHSHDWDTGPIGATIAARETDDGLEIEGDLYYEDDPLVKRIYRAMKDGVLREFSFAYDVIESVLVKGGEGEEEVRELRDLDLFEVGPTLVGMNPATQLLAAPKAWDAATATPGNFTFTWKDAGYVLVPITSVSLPASEPKSEEPPADVSDQQESEQPEDNGKEPEPLIELPRLHSEGEAR